MMKIIFPKFSNGTSLPILIRNSGLPILLPLTFCITILKGKANQTIIKHLSGIKLLYQYFEEKNIDLDECFINANYKVIEDSLDHILMWLYSGSYNHNQKDLKKPTSNHLYDLYLSGIKKFVHWSAIRYRFPLQTIKSMDSKIDSYFIHNPSKVKIFKSLDNEDLSRIREIINPTSISNPFRNKSHKVRNWIIFELLISTGIRIGELQKLKTIDLIKKEDHYFIQIIERGFDPEECRRIPPSLKNNHSQRAIAINRELFDLLEHYIKSYRRSINKRSKINHKFLFVSERGLPISYNTLADIFKTVEELFTPSNPLIQIQLTPHTLRHTYAERFLEFLIEHSKLDMERAKDELRLMCGWTPGSPMPSHYASNYIQKMANAHNVERLKLKLK